MVLNNIVVKDGLFYTTDAFETITAEEYNLIKERDIIKQYIATALSCARVEIIRDDGTILGFDANEIAQGRMDRAMNVLNNGETTKWKMYDNTEEVIAKEEFRVALRKAGELMTELWFSSTKDAVDSIVNRDLEWKYKFNSIW